MRRRLLILIDEMELGGTQCQIVELARHLDRSAFDVELVYFRQGSPYLDELIDMGVTVHQVPKRWKFDPLFFFSLCRLLRRGEYDVIHAFSFSGELWGWLANACAGRARFISSLRSVYEWFTPVQWTLKRWVTLGSDALIANSQAGADHAALNMGVRASSIHVVHNGLKHAEHFEAMARERAQRTGSADRLLFLGRLVGHKNVPCLLRAVAVLAKKRPGIRLDIVGDGPRRRELEAEAESLGIQENVAFHGSQSDVNPWLEKADVFVCTSLREGLSNAIMEAMAAGLPVVASNVGGNSELVRHDETGCLFPSNDHESLAIAIEELLADDDARRRMGESAHQLMRQLHDPRRMASRIEQIYARCLHAEGACAVQRRMT